MPKADLLWLCPDHLFDGEDLRPAHAIGLCDGIVEAVVPVADLSPREAAIRVAGTLSPGLVDLQVNGGGGVLLNNTQTPEALAAIAAAHQPLGTVALLPTVITDRPEVLARAVEASLAARGTPGVIGLHIEGPHLSMARRGTHDPDSIRPFEPATLAHVQRLRAAGIPVMITVAPESVTPAQIAELAATGAVVSLGHTDTDAETIRAALAAGATCFTHLFNAMSPMLNRAPGVTGAAINSAAYAGIICDGIHVADEMVGLAIRARPVPDRMFLVSDAMATVGGPDSFTLYGRTIRLKDGQLVNAEGSLAGAHVTMAQSVQRLIARVGVAPETALRMAVTVPARLMGRGDLARITGRAADDLVHLDPDWGLVGSVARLAPAVAASA